MLMGLGVLRLAPEAFWGMTMAEFLAAVEGYFMAQGVEWAEPVSRGEFEALRGRFPD